ncbi:hypothetical protein H5410_036289, partial [Solanum commersonii]
LKNLCLIETFGLDSTAHRVLVVVKDEELELKKMQQETKAIETSRKVIPSMSAFLSPPYHDETCYKAGDNMMYYSTGNKTTTLININDVPHNVGEGFLHARTLRQTITTTTTITPHMSKAQQVLGDNRDIKVSIVRKEYNYQQASKYCSS